MINLHVSIWNPWSDRFQSIRDCSGMTPFANKAWEFQIARTNEILGASLNISHRCDHAGFRIGLSLFSYNAEFNFYDVRHWDYDNQCYTTYTGDSGWN